MSTSKLQSTVSHYRTQLANNETKATSVLNQAHAHTVKVMQPHLDTLYQQIGDAQASGEPVPLHWLYEQNRLQATKAMIEGNINQYGALAQTQTGQLVSTGAQLGVKSGMTLLADSRPPGVHFSFGVPSRDAIESIVGATSEGSPLAALFAGFGEEAADGAAKALITGITLGENPRMIAPLVEDALDVSRARALTIARTEMLRAYRQAAMETYRANSDVVDSWIWVADLSPRTCAACLAMNGTEHSLDEDLDGHVNCRCVKLPKTKSWDDILGPLGIDTSDIDETSLDVQSGEDWFNEQSEEVQRSILGNKKYEAYANGDFTLSDLVGHAHSEDWGHSIYEKSLSQVMEGGEEATAVRMPKRINLEPIEEPAASEAASASKIMDELSERYPNTTFDLSGVDEAMAPKIAEQIKTLYEDYPDVGESIGYIGTGEGVDYDPHWDRGYVALTVDDYEGASSIFLNPTFFGREEAMALVFDEVDPGWFAADSGVESLISHEFGHSVYYYLYEQREESFLGFIDDMGGEGSVSAMMDEFFVLNDQYGDDVSGYAKAGGYKEAWAEAFSTLYNGKPGPYAEQMKTMLDQIFGSSWQKTNSEPMTPSQRKQWQAFIAKYIAMQ